MPFGPYDLPMPCDETHTLLEHLRGAEQPAF
jgi:hypothetical protein